MSVTDMLVHTLEIWRPSFDENDLDEYGQPAVDYGAEPLTTVRGLVQPKTVRELQLQSEAGPVIADHTIHLLMTDLRESDRIDRVDAGRDSYELTGIRRFDFGSFPHFEADARRRTDDTSQPEEEEGS